MKLKRPEIVIIAITLAFICFTAGYFMGRGSAARVITVGAASPPAASSGPPVVSADPEPPVTAAPGKIDINTANESELTSLPGIGPALAGRIIEYRELYGEFVEEQELMAVQGIGKKKFETLKHLICI